MSKKFLFLVEGQETEPDIIGTVFERYGFNSVKANRQTIDGSIEFNISELSDNKDNIVIAQAYNNRLEDVLKKYQDRYCDLGKLFSKDESLFAGIFLIFDVDHTSMDSLNELFGKFNNESDGLLLVNSPCIEVLSEPDRVQELIIREHFKEYKKERRSKINEQYHCTITKYICDHFEENVVKFLTQNYEEFNENNISLHPQLVIEQINLKNERNADGSAIIRYFTTVIYVAIAFVKGLLKQENNYPLVLAFFLEMGKKDVKQGKDSASPEWSSL